MSYNLLCNTALHRLWLLQLFLLARYYSASVFQAYVCINHLHKPRPMHSVDKHPLHTKPGDKVMILSPILKPFATGTIMLVKDCDDCAGASVSTGSLDLSLWLWGTCLCTSKAQLDEAAKTVFWRSNRDAGLKLGQAKCNFRTMQKAVEVQGVVVPMPQDRVAKIV
ncbi:hypothetical protein COO60DRAFT_1625647 [Scenedesmus sp. NREL 46B-D3]|nr:hypothetical protein COO60DRAFT_1625647 [Scenedesmus sp. NREL 46B-D3]